VFLEVSRVCEWGVWEGVGLRKRKKRGEEEKRRRRKDEKRFKKEGSSFS
jgi:hypothetical protein